MVRELAVVSRHVLECFCDLARSTELFFDGRIRSAQPFTEFTGTLEMQGQLLLEIAHAAW